MQKGGLEGFYKGAIKDLCWFTGLGPRGIVYRDLGFGMSHVGIWSLGVWDLVGARGGPQPGRRRVFWARSFGGECRDLGFWFQGLRLGH